MRSLYHRLMIHGILPCSQRFTNFVCQFRPPLGNQLKRCYTYRTARNSKTRKANVDPPFKAQKRKMVVTMLKKVIEKVTNLTVPKQTQKSRTQKAQKTSSLMKCFDIPRKGPCSELKHFQKSLRVP